MKKSLAIIAILCLSAIHMKAETSYNSYTKLDASQPLTFTVDSMPTSLTPLPAYNEEVAYSREQQPKLKTLATTTTTDYSNSIDVTGVKPYKFMDDMTFVGIPIFVAGIIAKSEKKSFRQDYNNKNNRTRLITNFHNEIDNYTQYAPFALSTVLNFAGVEGRSDHWRYLASSAMSYALMAAIVNPIKYTAKELRPDGTSRNSWPSGHTATAFVSATILHKEYGLTRSPWYSVAGYAVATATGVMRVLNNRHWVSDVLSGAGIGIFSTELAYGFSDLIFKGNHLKRNDLENTSNIIENPSFFSVSMGIGLGSRNLTFSGEDLCLYELKPDYSDIVNTDVELKFGAATVVGVEGAYFFNKYIGVGGRLKVRSTPIKGWSDVSSKFEDKIKSRYEDYKDPESGLGVDWWMSTHDLTIESDHITEFSANAGVYFNFPLTKRFALGSKLLIGRSVIQDLEVDAHFAGNQIVPKVDKIEKGDPYDITWEYMTVSGNNTMTYGTGLSLTYAYKSNFSWKVFVDYDFTRKHYTMNLNQGEYLKYADPRSYDAFCQDYDYLELNHDGTNLMSNIKKNMHNFVLGAAFVVSF